MKKELLPIGSVVSLKGAHKKLMITGILLEDENKTSYDYLGIPFPEGYIDSETMFLFMHPDIAEVHFLGYIDAETQAYRAAADANLPEKA